MSVKGCGSVQWIFGYGDGIEVTPQQLDARLDFIKDVSNAGVSPWKPLVVRGAAMPLPFFICTSEDGIPGVFITAHADAVHFLCERLYLGQKDIVVINSCLLIPNYGEQLLKVLSSANPQIELFFAKQETVYLGGPRLAKCVTISNIGGFGFQTSASERNMFRHRKLGLKNAIYASFDKVS